MYIDIDTSLEVVKPKLQLCKLNNSKEPIGNLTSAYNIKSKLSIGNISELSFDIPIYIDQHHKLKKTPHIDKIRERFIIKLTKGNYIEYYLITRINDVMDEDMEYKSVQCFSLGYQLASRLIKNYSVTSYNLTSTVNDLLAGTSWGLGSVDADFDIRFRSFELSTSVLDAIIQVAETFGATIVWDTDNKLINFYQLDNIGQTQGFKVKYGKLLKNLNKETNTDEQCTRLRGYGRNELTINAVNPLGTNYIQSFDYFKYPFQSDGNGNVLVSSDYMSDELCLALEAYEQLIDDNEDTYANYLAQLNALTSELATLQNQLLTLQTELATIEDNLAVANATGGETSSLISQKNAKQVEINNKNSEISSKESEISSVNTNINNLKTLLAEENNFTVDELEELSQFIIEKEFTNDNYTDAQQLYDAMVEEFDKIREPKIVVNIGIVNLLEILSEQKNWNKLNLGDTITIEHERLGIDIEAKIVEVEFDYENADINITIANVKEILNDEDRFIKEMYKTISSSTSVEQNQYKWNDTSKTTSEVYNVINGVWDATQRRIVAGVNNSVSISNKGIVITDPNDPLKQVILQHNQIALTQDGGNNWQSAILPDKIVADRIMGTLLAGVNLVIDASTPEGTRIFKVDSNGVLIEGTSLTIQGGLSESQLDPEFVQRINDDISDVNTSISNLQSEISELSSDGQITLSEANTLKLSYGQVESESLDLINIANILSITTEKTEYSSALSTLSTELSQWIDQENYPIEITESQRTSIQDAFELVQNTKSILINKISEVREQSAKDYAVGKGIDYNGVKIDAENGIVVTKGDNKVRAIFNATEGIKIQSSTNGIDWIHRFYYDIDNDRLSMTGDINAQAFSINGDNVLNSNGQLTVNSANIIGSITASSVAAGISISSPNITGGSISSGTTINVGTDITVGKNIYLAGQNDFTDKRIHFASGSGQGASIHYANGLLAMKSDSSISLNAMGSQGVVINNAKMMAGSIDGDPLAGQLWVQNWVQNEAVITARLG